MSGEASGWVYRHSSAKGATFTVHAAIGDSANDQYRYEFWMNLGALAENCRLARPTVSEAVAWLVKNGYLENIDEEQKRRRPSRAVRYRFLMPSDEPVRWSTDERVRRPRGVTPGDTSEKVGVTHDDTQVSPTTTPGVTHDDTYRTQEEPKQEHKHVDEDVDSVFEAWQSATGRRRCKLDPARRRLIIKALKDYPLADVVDAVNGWRRSPYHRGENGSGTTYDSLGLLLRDAEHIEKFRDLERDEGNGNGRYSTGHHGERIMNW